MGHTYLKASLIKVIDILLKNAIFYYGILNKIKLLVDDFWILTFCTLVIIFVGIFGYKIIMPLDKVADLVLSSR